ncbi:MAG: TonB-dependent receptor plug domain-containing protein, partial [Candidatus Aminicenantes bacterium]|nr:TonB-dependent receptor plug domain-containing protein [Candidatus Aminicenantes bacterium]
MNDIKAFARKSVVLMMILFIVGSFLPADEPDDKKNEQEKDELKPIIEEVVVTGETPAQQPISTVSIIKKEKIEKLVPKNLGNVMNQAAGAYVTEGAKNEADVKIRGLSSNRITLMYDGIPIYEPYFNTFDLKSITAAGLDNIKIIKGTGSVLYGPNTLGGVINVLSERPTQPFLSLNADAGENDTYFLSGSGGYSWEKFAFFSNVTLDRSDGFDFEKDGERVKRDNSDYKHYNFAGKFYFYPTERSEIMAQVLYHTADYGIPAATEYSKARYWHFDD